MYSIKQRTNAYWRLTRLNQPIGIWLLLWPTLWALWLSSNSGPTYGIFYFYYRCDFNEVSGLCY